MYGELIPQGGGDPIPLLKDKLLIGRREKCDITLGFPNISGKHCELILSQGYWYVRDLDSRNGVKIGGTRIDERRLDPGTIIQIAKHRYEVRYDPVANGAVGPPPPDKIETDIFSKSLMERAGLQKRDLKTVAKHSESALEQAAFEILGDEPDPKAK